MVEKSARRFGFNVATFYSFNEKKISIPILNKWRVFKDFFTVTRKFGVFKVSTVE